MRAITPRGVEIRGNSLRIAFMFEGQVCKETVKLAPTPPNLKWAERKRAAVLHDIATGTFDYSKHFPQSKRARAARPDAHRTVDEAIHEWLDSIEKETAYSTWTDYRNMVDNVLVPRFGALTLEKFATAGEELREWRNALKCGPKRANNLLIPLRGMADREFYAERMERNPLARVKSLEVHNREADPFEPGEVNRILAAAADGQERALLQLAFGTGVRTGELIGLRWDAVDLRRGVVRIERSVVRGRNRENTKTSAGRRDITLLDGAKGALREQRAHTELMGGAVFHRPDKGQPWKSPTEIAEMLWYPTLKRAGVRPRNLYQTRHTYASTALMGGFPELRDMAPMALVMWLVRQMGHTDASMIFKVYGKYLNGLAPVLTTLGGHK